MEKKRVFTRILAVTGTVLVWFPILAPFLGAAIALATRQWFLFDFLMPAELYPVALCGSLLLLWASIRAQSRRKLIGWSLACGAGLLVGSQVLAVVTGLASGRIEPEGPWFILVMTVYAGFALALIVTGVGGVLLLRDLFKPGPGASAAATGAPA